MRSAAKLLFVAMIMTIGLGLGVDVSAERFTGGSYTIDASVIGNSFGGATSGGSYQLASSGGESVIGQGSGGSYKIGSGYVAQLESSLQLTVQPGNLKAYYALDEPSGTFARDTSFNNFNGTTANNPSWTTGKIGGGLDFTASNQYLSVPITWTPPSDWSISFWIYPRSASDYNQQVHSAGNWTGFMFHTTSSGGMYVGTANDASRFTPANIGSITLNQWQKYTYTYSGGTASFYKNGVFLASKSQPASGAWSALDIGNGILGYGADGVFDELKIFSRSLSANEVKAEYDAQSAGNASGLSFASNIISGVSQTSDYDAAVLTDAQNGYTLSVNQNQNLTKGADTISAVSGSIASPVSWVEGTTKGLGFTLYGTNATAIPGKWSSGAAYAAFPGSATSYYVRTGKQSAKDVLNMRLRLDVVATQPSGTYTNVITTTGTITP